MVPYSPITSRPRRSFSSPVENRLRRPCSLDVLPLSYMRLVGAEAIKLGSRDKHPTCCLDFKQYLPPSLLIPGPGPRASGLGPRASGLGPRPSDSKSDAVSTTPLHLLVAYLPANTHVLSHFRNSIASGGRQANINR